MGKTRKVRPINAKEGLPEVQVDELDEIIEAVLEKPDDQQSQPMPAQPLKVAVFQDHIIRQLEKDQAETQAHLTALTRRQERLAFGRQKAANQDAVRFVLQRLNEQIVRAEARLEDIQRTLIKEYRLAQCRREIQQLKDELHKYRTMTPVLTDRLSQLQQELDEITGAHHEPILLERTDETPAKLSTAAAV